MSKPNQPDRSGRWMYARTGDPHYLSPDDDFTIGCPYCRQGIAHDHYVLEVRRESRGSIPPESVGIAVPVYRWPAPLPRGRTPLPTKLNHEALGVLDDLLTKAGVDEPFFVEIHLPKE
jgi:hypothetical protein